METKSAINGNRRNSRLTICYWTYGVLPHRFKVEMEVWTESKPDGDGFIISTRFEARLHEESEEGNARFLAAIPLQDSTAVQTHIAHGRDPLFEMFKAESKKGFQVLGAAATGLASLYESLVLGKASRETANSITGPRL